MKLVISKSVTISINLILTYECKDFSNQKWEKQKTPLLRGLIRYVNLIWFAEIAESQLNNMVSLRINIML